LAHLPFHHECFCSLRWVKAGKHYGESESYLRGGNVSSVFQPSANEDAPAPEKETMPTESMEEVALRDTYDEIYKNNIQDGPHSQKLAEKSLKWVLCCARPLEIEELGAAVSVEEEEMVETELIVSLCSNLLLIDQGGFVRLAHLSVREYLEVKVVDGIKLFAPEASHVEVATTCLFYWMKIRGGESTEDEASLDDETVDVKETRLEGKSSESGGKLPSSTPRKPETLDKEID
jgi:hypothetical protein